MIKKWKLQVFSTRERNIYKPIKQQHEKVW